VNGLSKLTFVCIPAYNEEDSIRSLIEDTLSFAPGNAMLKVAVVDNGSTDRTVDIVRELCVKYPDRVFLNHIEHGCGITKVYSTAFNFAMANGAEYIIGMDAGYSHRPSHIPQFINLLEYYDCVFGSRKLGTYDGPLKRRIISKLGNISANLFLGIKSTDATSGFVGLRREVLEKVKLEQFQSRWYFYDTELKYYCQDLGFKCTEMPINYVSTSSSFKYSHIKEAVRTLAYLSAKRLERGLQKPPDKMNFMFP